MALPFEDEGHQHTDEQQLEHAHPEMPCHGAQLPEVHLAERDEQHQKHEHGQDGGHDGCKEIAGLVECRGEGEQQIEHRACTHRDGQRPVFYKSYDIHFGVQNYTK